VIVRILGEGQLKVSDEHLETLNSLDSALESAVDTGNEEAFRAALTALLDKIRAVGERLPDDSLEDSDLFLPPSDATVDEVKELLGDEGLIPG
jgi:hypothetical protein